MKLPLWARDEVLYQYGFIELYWLYRERSNIITWRAVSIKTGRSNILSRLEVTVKWDSWTVRFWKYLLQEQFGIQPHKQPRPGGWQLGMSRLLNHPHQFDEIWCNVWFGLKKKNIYIYILSSSDQTPKLRILISLFF